MTNTEQVPSRVSLAGESQVLGNMLPVCPSTRHSVTHGVASKPAGGRESSHSAGKLRTHFIPGLCANESNRQGSGLMYAAFAVPRTLVNNKTNGFGSAHLQPQY